MASVLCVVLLSWVLQKPPTTFDPSASFGNLVEQARTEYWKGHLAQSEALFMSALRTFPAAPESQRAKALSELGDVYVNEDELQKAEQAYLKSLAIYKAMADKGGMALLLRNLGAVYSLERRDDEALQALQQALKMARAGAGTNAGLIGQVLNNLGVAFYRQGNMSKAEKFFTEAAQYVSPTGGPLNRADLLNNLGVVYHQRRQFQKAEDYLLRALKVIESQVGTAHPDLTFSLSALGGLYTETHKYALAEEQYRRALAILEPGKVVFETRIARLLHALSGTYASAGRKADADATLARATDIARRNVSKHPDMAVIMDAYAGRLKKEGKVKEAEELRVEANRARVAAGLVINAHRPF